MPDCCVQRPFVITTEVIWGADDTPTDFILTEDSFYLLQEDGSKIGL